jgi:CDP-diacylglycerol--glycerol-3-phosphate 3-phosphatidyltransferase
MNIPNILTSIRIFLIPVIVICYFFMPQPASYVTAAALFTVAAVTDWLDGYLARKLDQSTPFGAFFDPVADKITVSVALIMLVSTYGNTEGWFLMTLAALVIIGREIMVSALREWMAELGKRANVQVSWIGKFKTAFQMIATILLLARPANLGDPIVMMGMGMMYLAVILTLWSMIKYLAAAMPYLLPDSDRN